MCWARCLLQKRCVMVMEMGQAGRVDNGRGKGPANVSANESASASAGPGRAAAEQAELMRSLVGMRLCSALETPSRRLLVCWPPRVCAAGAVLHRC